jgi:hypothetical protein
MTLDQSIRERFARGKEDETSSLRYLSDAAQKDAAPELNEEEVAMLAERELASQNDTR